MAAEHQEEELLDYEDEEQGLEQEKEVKAADGGKKGYVGIHAAAFKDFLLKPEILRAIQECGFEHPSEGGQGEGGLLGAA